MIGWIFSFGKDNYEVQAFEEAQKFETWYITLFSDQLHILNFRTILLSMHVYSMKREKGPAQNSP